MKSWEQLRHDKQGSDQVAGSLDGYQPNAQGASQPMSKHCKSCKSTTPVTDRNIFDRNRTCESSTDSQHPCHRAVQKRSLLWSKERQPVRPPPATSHWTSQINPGCTSDTSHVCSNEKLRTHTGRGGPRCQTSTDHTKASRHVQCLQDARALQLPYSWCTGRPGNDDGAPTCQRRWDDVLARNTSGVSGQGHHTGRQHHNQKSHRSMSKMKGKRSIM